MGFEILTGRQAGFCWGVKRAVNGAVGQQEKSGEEIFVFGHLVHNEIVIEDLKKQGVKILRNLEEAEGLAWGKVILITAHGIDPAIRTKLEAIASRVVDMTCPIVKNVHQAAIDLIGEGRKMILVGAPANHQEVLGIMGVLGNKAFLVSSMKDVFLIPYKQFEQIGVVSQTTFNEDELQRILQRIKEKFPNTEYRSYPSIVDPEYSTTICDDISRKQRELRELSQTCNRIVVVGSQTSANSKHLAEIAQWELKKPTQFVLRANELDECFFRGAVRVLLTAGASTPASSVSEVLAQLKRWGGHEIDLS